MSEIIDNVVQKIRSREDVGTRKYGTDMDRRDLSRLDWLNHAQEELMDAVNYLEKLIVEERAEQTEPLPLP